MKRLFVICAAAAALFANAQGYPGSKAITIVVPFAAGGPTDLVARQLGETMRKTMGQGANFLVENSAGAGGTIGATKVARAAPDGHTLLLFHIGMAATPALYKKIGYKPLEDFEFLGMINEVPMTLIGKPQLPANTYRDFEAYIKANAGKLNIAHAGLGSASHLCSLMWQSAVKANEAMTTIPYGGTAPAMNALLGGQVDMMCDQSTNTTQQIQTGRVKAFAVTTAKPLSRHPLLKDYPTLQEMGLKGFELTVWHGLYAPKGTPPAVLKQLNDALKLALKDPDFIRKQDALGAVVITDSRIEPAAHIDRVGGSLSKPPVLSLSKGACRSRLS